MEKIGIDIGMRNWRPSPIAGPIALVTTIDAQGHVNNVAPKSLIIFATVRPLRIPSVARAHITLHRISSQAANAS